MSNEGKLLRVCRRRCRQRRLAQTVATPAAASPWDWDASPSPSQPQHPQPPMSDIRTDQSHSSGRGNNRTLRRRTTRTLQMRLWNIHLAADRDIRCENKQPSRRANKFD